MGKRVEIGVSEGTKVFACVGARKPRASPQSIVVYKYPLSDPVALDPFSHTHCQSFYHSLEQVSLSASFLCCQDVPRYTTFVNQQNTPSTFEACRLINQ